MRRWSILVLLLAGLVLWGVGGNDEANALEFTSADPTKTVWKVDPLGVTPFLVGRWTGGDPKTGLNDKTKITLQNPTDTDQEVLILYYDKEERFLQCDSLTLTPHDIETKVLPNTDRFGKSMFKPAAGAFEVLTTQAKGVKKRFSELFLYSGVLSGDTKWIEEEFHGGIVGDLLIGGDATLHLHKVNFLYWNPPDENHAKYSQCLCDEVGNIFDFLPDGVDCD